MFYKNLPADELQSVMTRRAWLDRLAMLQYLLKADFPNAKAVYQARREYKRLRPDFVNDRVGNLQKTSTHVIPERIKNSILWQFYVRGMKRFSLLPNFK